MNKEKSTEISVFESLSSPSLGQLASDSIEVALDAVLEDGILRDIPIVGALINSGRAVIGIRDKLFAKKVLEFLGQIASMPMDKRQEFANSMANQKGGPEKLGAAIVLLIERADDLRKPILFGRIFLAGANGIIPLSDVFRLCSAVDRVYVDDLDVLARISEEDVIPNEVLHSLASAGLLAPRIRKNIMATMGRSVSVLSPEYADGMEIKYTLTSLGDALALVLSASDNPQG